MSQYSGGSDIWWQNLFDIVNGFNVEYCTCDILTLVCVSRITLHISNRNIKVIRLMFLCC